MDTPDTTERAQKEAEVSPAAPMVSPEFEVTARHELNITFRTRLVFPIKSTVYLAGRDGVEVGVKLRSAFLLDDDRVEYTGQVDTPNADFAHYSGPLSLRDHPEEERPSSPTGLPEQRKAQRMPRTFQIMSRDLQHYKARSADISETGLRIMADEPLSVGKSMQLTLDFDDSKYPHLRCKAEVVWCRPKDPQMWWIGLKFTQMSTTHRQLTSDYVRNGDETTSAPKSHGTADGAPQA